MMGLVPGPGQNPESLRRPTPSAAQAFGLSRSKSYDLVRRGEFPCRVLPIGRTAHVVTASLLRMLESGEPEYNGALQCKPQSVLTNCTTTPPPE
jgi:hypothetical protein